MKDERERSLLRILCMGRVMTSDLAKLLKRAFHALVAVELDPLVKSLSVDGIGDGSAVIPNYIPTVFAKGLKTVSRYNGDDSRKVDVLKAIMCFLSRVYDVEDLYTCEEGRVVECSLLVAADFVESDGFYASPVSLGSLRLERICYSWVE